MHSPPLLLVRATMSAHAQECKRFSYTKLKELGRGTFGVVFLVARTATGECFVMKEVSLRGMPSGEIRNTKNEVRVLQRLHHDHVISYVDSFVVEGRDPKLCIIMEWASGGDLAGLISRRKKMGARFSEAELLSMLHQMCLGLAYCHHDLKLLHRDLKPANIFLSAAGSIKIGDFGISKVLPISNALAQTQCGSPLYMSPEMVKGEPYSQAADSWAIGCILYELMSLTPPWMAQLGHRDAADGVAGVMRVISAQRLNTDRARAHYSMELCALLSALVTRDPSKRPSCASVLSWPVMRRHLSANRVPPAPAAGLAFGADAHVAAHAIQRSFRRSLGRGLVLSSKGAESGEAAQLATVNLIEGGAVADAAVDETLVLRETPDDVDGEGGRGEANAAAAAYARRAAFEAAHAVRQGCADARAAMMARMDRVSDAFAHPERADITPKPPGGWGTPQAPNVDRAKPPRAANPSARAQVQPQPAQRMPSAPVSAPVPAPVLHSGAGGVPLAPVPWPVRAAAILPHNRAPPPAPAVRPSSAFAAARQPVTGNARMQGVPSTPLVQPGAAAAERAAVLARQHFDKVRAMQRARHMPAPAATPDQVRAAAAQKIIDSFKSSLEKRRLEGPTRNPTAQQRQTLNRRVPRPGAAKPTARPPNKLEGPTAGVRLAWPEQPSSAQQCPTPSQGAARVATPLAACKLGARVSELKQQYEHRAAPPLETAAMLNVRKMEVLKRVQRANAHL